MDLSQIRERIDDTDRKLLRLLAQRMEYAVRAGRLKPAVTDPAREAEVLDNARAGAAHGLLGADFVTSIFRGIIDEAKQVQARAPRLAGFQGEHGAWGEMAVRGFAQPLVPIPCREFAEVFDGVAKGDFDLGVVPVENSLEGAVTEVNDLLVETDLKIVGEVLVPVNQCLLGLPGSDYREIKVVCSHPQALAQCRAFLARHKLEARPFYDTAGAARWLASESPRSTAVIASPLAAELYGLDVIKEGVQDNNENVTRFVVLSKEGATGDANKCSLVFSTPHRAGALFDVLRCFAERRINLTRIESRPIRRAPGTYAFLLDFQGSADQPDVREALGELAKLTVMSKVLGFYKAGGAAR